MTQQTLEEYRAMAEQHGDRRSAKIVLKLLDEVVRLRHLWNRNEIRRNQVSDESLMPFGQYKGERMVDVPEDYLVWWQKENNRDGLKLDAEFAPVPRNYVAQRKLRIYDYIQQRIDDETRETEAELSEAEILAFVQANGFPNATIIPDEADETLVI